VRALLYPAHSLALQATLASPEGVEADAWIGQCVFQCIQGKTLLGGLFISWLSAPPQSGMVILSGTTMLSIIMEERWRSFKTGAVIEAEFKAFMAMTFFTPGMSRMEFESAAARHGREYDALPVIKRSDPLDKLRSLISHFPDQFAEAKAYELYEIDRNDGMRRAAPFSYAELVGSLGVVISKAARASGGLSVHDLELEIAALQAAARGRGGGGGGRGGRGGKGGGRNIDPRTQGPCNNCRGDHGFAACKKVCEVVGCKMPFCPGARGEPCVVASQGAIRPFI
jgi:hypothetical protein